MLAPAAEDGDTKVHTLHMAQTVHIHQNRYPKTVGGLFLEYIVRKGDDVHPQAWLIKIKAGVQGGHVTGNAHMPDNLYLLCGDTAVNVQMHRLAQLAGDDNASYK